MRFWDASALVPLCLEQSLSGRARTLLKETPQIVVWWASPVECASAFARVRRDELVGLEDEAAALTRLRQLQDSWFEINPGANIRTQAQRLLRIHPLRAADALQLAAALEWAGTTSSAEMVTFDERLGAAARLEGFHTL